MKAPRPGVELAIGFADEHELLVKVNPNPHVNDIAQIDFDPNLCNLFIIFVIRG